MLEVTMSTYNALSFFEFQEQFRTEENCFHHLHKLHWSDGFCCPKCGHTKAYFMKKRKVFQCASCRNQTSLTANTIFHKTRTPLRKWFWAVYLIGSDKRGCSAKRLSGLIDVSYPTAWLMIHKVRKAMKDRDTLYKLNQFIEMDDSFFGRKSVGKRGRGASNKSKVVVAVENRGKHAGYATMQVIEHVDSNNLNDFVYRNIEPYQTIKTDAYPSYNVLKMAFDHQKEIVKAHEAMEKLPWVHILIGNVKSFIRGTYHGVSHKHLQSYLSEFCYRFNRRFFENQMTDRILTACLNTQQFTFAELTL
jgi:transposase-like protein